jgi:hypothetical protein
MPDFLIHQCTLSLIRRGGWSWGPDPKALVERLVRSVPAILESRLASLYAGDVDLEIAAPVTVRVPVRFAELDSFASDLPALSTSGNQEPRSSLERKFAIALDQALQGWLPASRINSPSKNPSPPLDTNEGTSSHRNLGEPLERLLTTLHQRGQFEQFLERSTATDIEHWHSILSLKIFDQHTLPPAIGSSLIEKIAASLQSKIDATPPASGTEAVRARLRLAIAAAVEFQIPAVHPALWRMIDGVLPSHAREPLSLLMRDEDSLVRTESDASVPATRPDRSTLAATQLSQANPASSLSRNSESWDVHVPCAIPFLLLRPLSSMGLLDAFSVALQSAKCSNSASLLAVGLAYKILEPPDRGWLRSSGSLATAAAFAGLRSAADESDVVEIARQLASGVDLVERLIADSLLAGHSEIEPYLLCHAPVAGKDGLLLIDAQGCFPIRWTAADDFLNSLTARLKNSILCIAPDAGEPAFLNALTQAGIRFVIEAAPTRGEQWQRVPLHQSANIWTNHSDPSSPAILRAALQLRQSSEEAASFWQLIGRSRTAAVRAPSPAFDVMMSLVAGAATGAIAWELWRDRGRTTPQMVLERFGDLDAYVQFTPASVQIRLPLGRRHRELLDHGLLNPIDEVPWLHGRRVEFLGG